MTLLPDRDAIRAHFEALYGTADDGFLALWHLPSKRTEWVPVADLDLAAATATRLGQTGNVYAGVGLHPAPLGSDRRGEAAGVSALPGLFAEIDVAGPGHAAGALPPDLDAVRALAKAVPLPPSHAVHSGGGVHLYWLFREVWAFADGAERTHAARLARALQWLLIRAARDRGWTIDNTSDLSRVLRPAGTVNRKAATGERPVRLLAGNGPRYGLEDLEAVLPLEDDFFPPRAMLDPTPRGPVRAPAAFWTRVVAGCGYLRHCQDDASALSEPEWHAAMTVVGRCVGGDAVAHRISAPYPAYDPAETRKKFAYAAARDNPIRCETVRYQRGGEPWCARCPWWGRISSPIQLGYPPGYRYQRPLPAAAAEERRDG